MHNDMAFAHSLYILNGSKHESTITDIQGYAGSAGSVTEFTTSGTIP